VSVRLEYRLRTHLPYLDTPFLTLLYSITYRSSPCRIAAILPHSDLPAMRSCHMSEAGPSPIRIRSWALRLLVTISPSALAQPALPAGWTPSTRSPRRKSAPWGTFSGKDISLRDGFATVASEPNGGPAARQRVGRTGSAAVDWATNADSRPRSSQMKLSVGP
jgi:hypothetical protein